jgi:hypothetical protein
MVHTDALTFDPRNLSKLYRRTADGNKIADPILDGASTVLEAFYEERTLLHELESALKDDPSLSGPARATKLRSQAMKAREHLAKLVEEAMPKFIELRDKLDAKTAAPAAPTSPVDLALESDLRAAIRGMKSTEKLKLIDQLDDRIAGAALRGHPITAGLTASEQDMIRDRYRQSAHPGASETLYAWNEAISKITEVDKEFARQTKGMVDNTDALRVERSQERIAAATANGKAKGEAA